MRSPKTILLFLLFFIRATIALAQTIERYNSFSYNVNEGLLQSNVLDMEFDNNNFCWLAFANGIQKFDGKDFIDVPVQPGLPDDKWVKFFRCSNGNLLISHAEGISKYDVISNKFTQVYKTDLPKNKPVNFIGEDNDNVYVYDEESIITGIDCKTFKVTSETATGFSSYSFNTSYIPRISNIVNHHFAVNVDSTVYIWDLSKRRVVYKSPRLGIFFYFLELRSDHEFLYFSHEHDPALQLFDIRSGSSRAVLKEAVKPETVLRINIYSWNKRGLLSYGNHLYEIDPNTYMIKKELVNFQNESFTGAAITAMIKEDNFGNLYLVTINDGFRKIIRTNYPIKYYGTQIKKDNYVISLLPDKEHNRVLAGTYGSGLFVFDTAQQLVKHILKLPLHTASFSPSMMVKTPKGDYILFVWGDECIWWLGKDLEKMEPIKIIASPGHNKSTARYFGNPLFQNEKEVFAQTETNCYRINFDTKKAIRQELASTATLSGIAYDSTILTHTNDELIFINAADFKEIKRVPFKNTGGVRCFAKDISTNLYVGSNKGIFKIDREGRILSHLDKAKGLPDECIYAMVVDDEGFLWCSTNKGVFRVNKDNSVLQITKDDGLQENEFNTNAAAKTADGEVFFAGVNGVSSFFPSAINNKEESIKLLFTHIKVNNEELFADSAAWSVDKINLKYNENSLSFDFIAMANNNPGQYIYQYRMEAVDKQWLQNNDLQTVHYHLPPGKYVFKIYASRFFNKEAKPMKELVIIIDPPFWKTWWFRTLIGILLFSLMAFIINQLNKRKYDKKIAELESEHKIRLERERISRDLHDSIGAYANAVLYNTELLENEKEGKLREELMKDLKYASKDIITSLRETIWALKKDNYTAEECLLRIRNFVQPLTRYYQQINFEVEADVPAGKILHYSKALNLVQIVQEAVTNSIKHANAKNIRVISNTKDNTWELMITDDGTGFNQDNIAENIPGNGLGNMKQRAADASFGLEISSSQGSGTSIIIRVNG